MNPEARQAHWDQVWSSQDHEDTSWFDPDATESLAMFDALAIRPAASVIDVGGGASRLVDRLLDRGFSALTVFDLAEASLDQARHRLGQARAGQVRWVVGDVLDGVPMGPYDVWHDRAVYHFLIDAEDRKRYRKVLLEALSADGLLLLSVFAPDGPDRCAGLPVHRADAHALAAEFAERFEVLGSRRIVHATPAGDQQPFVQAWFRRVA